MREHNHYPGRFEFSGSACLRPVDNDAYRPSRLFGRHPLAQQPLDVEHRRGDGVRRRRRDDHLVERSDQLTGKVVFMFQPGEEGHHGARLMLDEGLLDGLDVTRAFAIHQSPSIPSGMITRYPSFSNWSA